MNQEVVDQFAGPGGWDLAARWLGLDPLGIENDDAACATREAAGLRTIQSDIRKVDPIPAWGLISSPPCPTFSAAGKGSGRKELPIVIDIAKRLVAGEDWRLLTTGLEDERTGLVLEPLHWIVEMHRVGMPYRWIALEQVPAVLPVWQLYADILRTLGYSAWAGKLTSEMYGVPQTRIRAILIASLDREVTAPSPTHSKFYPRDRTKLDPGVRKWVSMSEALGWGMTERPYPVLAMSRTTGGPDKEKVGGSEARARIYAERDAGRWIPQDDVELVNNTSRNAGVRLGNEPVPSMYFGERLNKMTWQVRNSGPGAARDPRPVDEAPSYTIRANGSGSHPSGVEWASERHWGHEAPATSIAGDPRMSGRAHHYEGDQGRDSVTVQEALTNGARPEQPVRVSYIEAAILQSFPADYPWQGTKTKKHQQIGNAIPPLLAYHVLAMATGMPIEQPGNEEQVTEETQAPPTTEKWLTPKASKDAKAYGASLGHRIGRFTVKNNMASAKCKLCDARMEITRTSDGEADAQLVNKGGERGEFRCGDEPSTANEPGYTDADVTDSSQMTGPPSEAYVQAKTAEAAMVQRIADARVRFDAGLSSPDALLMSTGDDGGGGQYLGELVAQEANELLMGDDVLDVAADAGPNAQVSAGGWIAPTSYIDDDKPPVQRRWTMPPPLPMTPILGPDGQPWDPFAEMIQLIERFTEIDERSQQKLIGPSEIGLDCDRCLAKKLLQIPMTRETAWLPAIGRAVHNWLERELKKCGDDCGWMSERKVPIGIIGDRLIKGTADAFKNGVVLDFKVVGETTLKKVKSKGASSVYRGQAHSYGRGFELEGYEVTHVMVLYLPRNSPTLANAEKHIEPYSREIAAQVLERAHAIYNTVTTDPSALIRLPRATDCYDCYRFAPLPGEDTAIDNQPRAGQPFAGILT